MISLGTLGRSAAVLASLSLFTAPPRAARAAGFELQTLQPAAAGDRFLLAPDGGVRGDHLLSGRLLASYAYRPLLRRALGATSRELVSSQLYFNLGGAYTFGRRVLVGADLPLVAVQGVDDAASPTSTGLGDFRLSGRVRLASVEHVDLGVEGRAWLPTGSTAALAGDGAFRSSLHVAASGGFGPVRYSASFGFLARERRTLSGAEIGPAVPFAVGAGVALLDERLFVGPELSGHSVVGGDAAFLSGRTTPIVGLLGARYRVVSNLVFGLALGPGLTSAPGVSPRVALSVGWEPEAEPPPETSPEAAPEATPKASPADEFDATHMIPGAPPPPPPDAVPPTPTTPGPQTPPPAPPAPPAPSPPSEEALRDQARQLFKDGVVAYDRKRYAEAITAFETAYRMKPHPIVLLNLAQSELMAGKHEAACAHFKTWQGEAVGPSPSVSQQASEGIRAACH